MCIAVLSTAHPQYPFILLSNRDEFLSRPTARASFWPTPHADVLAGRDLLRPEQGTWLGVTRDGRVAVLTNYRDEGDMANRAAVSRGAIIKDFLTAAPGQRTDDYVARVVKDARLGDVGGFSLVCGRIGERLAVLSNRDVQGHQANGGATGPGAGVPWIMGDAVMTAGLSNTSFGSRGWLKVEKGEAEMLKVIQECVRHDVAEDDMIRMFFDLLSLDTLPRPSLHGGLETYVGELRNTIFVPPLGKKAMDALPHDEIAGASTNGTTEVARGAETSRPGLNGIYATQKQTVILVDRRGRLRFVERTLYDDDSNPVPVGQGDVDISFDLEGWPQ